MSKKLFWIKESERESCCPLCVSPLGHCSIGVYCKDKECPYVDGVAWLTPAQIQKFKSKILGPYIFPE